MCYSTLLIPQAMFLVRKCLTEHSCNIGGRKEEVNSAGIQYERQSCGYTFWPGLLGMGCVACELKVDQGDGTLWGIIHN